MENNSQALKEVYEVLKCSSKEVNNRIPYKFKRYLYKNMDKEYCVNIDHTKHMEEQNISKKAKNILGLLYRDYLVDNKKRQTLIKEEMVIAKRIEDEKLATYNPDSLFKEKNKTKIENEELSVTTCEKENIFKRIIKYIKSIKNKRKE